MPIPYKQIGKLGQYVGLAVFMPCFAGQHKRVERKVILPLITWPSPVIRPSCLRCSSLRQQNHILCLITTKYLEITGIMVPIYFACLATLHCRCMVCSRLVAILVLGNAVPWRIMCLVDDATTPFCRAVAVTSPLLHSKTSPV